MKSDEQGRPAGTPGVNRSRSRPSPTHVTATSGRWDSQAGKQLNDSTPEPTIELCNYFNCFPSFWKSTNGYFEQGQDGTFSHSGGRSGACSYHGGERRHFSDHEGHGRHPIQRATGRRLDAHDAPVTRSRIATVERFPVSGRIRCPLRGYAQHIARAVQVDRCPQLGTFGLAH